MNSSNIFQSSLVFYQPCHSSNMLWNMYGLTRSENITWNRFLILILVVVGHIVVFFTWFLVVGHILFIVSRHIWSRNNEGRMIKVEYNKILFIINNQQKKFCHQFIKTKTRFHYFRSGKVSKLQIFNYTLDLCHIYCSS